MDEDYRCENTIDLEEALYGSLGEALYGSRFTIKGAADHYGVPRSTFSNWVNEKSQPRGANKRKLEYVMKDIIKHPKREKHPSYGWATSEQIEKLKHLSPSCPERDLLLKKIAQQNRNKGKV